MNAGIKSQENEEKRKAFERAEKEHEEMKNAAMRIVDFISEDEGMKKMTPGHIRSVLNMAYGIISKAAGCITLEKLCGIYAQMAKDSSQGQPACQESHPAS